MAKQLADFPQRILPGFELWDTNGYVLLLAQGDNQWENLSVLDHPKELKYFQLCYLLHGALITWQVPPATVVCKDEKDVELLGFASMHAGVPDQQERHYQQNILHHILTWNSDGLS